MRLSDYCNIPGLSEDCFKACAGVGLVGLRADGDPCPVACPGVGLPGLTADGTSPFRYSTKFIKKWGCRKVLSEH